MSKRPNPWCSNADDAIPTANNAAYRRKLRKMILDNKRSMRQKITALNDNLTSSSNAAYRRKLKKIILDSNKSKRQRITTPNDHLLSVSNAATSNLNQCIPHGPSFVTQPTEIQHLSASIHATSLTRLHSGNGQYLFETPIQVKNTAASTIMKTSLTKLRPGKHKLLPQNQNLEQLPITEIVEDSGKGISNEYKDHGDQSVTCEMCNAKLWKSEAGKGRKTLDKLTYALCCGYGKVELPDLKDAHPSYQSLFQCLDSKSKYFIKNVRRYNSMFSFTSMGGKVDNKINTGKAPFIYRISGQNCHNLGSLLPENGCNPKFSQLYIYDTENEVSNRQHVFRDSKNKSSTTSQEVDMQLIEYIKGMLDSENELVKTYRMVRDHFHENPNVSLKLRLISKRDKDGRVYNLPTSSEVAALIVGDINDIVDHRDIVVETQTGYLQRISELHPSYLALQYPILFPYGDDGYRIDIPHRDGISTQKKIPPKCTMREFFAYRIQDRLKGYSLILNSRRLFQQFLVDAYTMIESERLNYIRSQQQNLRCDSFENLNNLSKKGQTDLSNTGQRVILPSSFTGGARYMQQNYLDAMSLCKWYGYPDFFITITCNPKWPEIRRYLSDKTIKAEDRPDILCRLFKIKLDAIIKDLKDKHFFGDINAVVYTIEFQKRGLPHAHVCLFLKLDHKLPTVDQIDPFISAEIPDKNIEPELHSLVTEFMIHGPCGNANKNCPCMIDDVCSKNFPKNFAPQTTVDENGFPIYRRRDNGHTVMKAGVELDNRYVVPYNKKLLKRYQAHINVEWCNQGGSIKYLFKYINKGPDRASVAVTHEQTDDNHQLQRNEIKEYYDCRYVSACEASWRIFSNDVHYRFPSVMRLPFHLPNQQHVVFGANEDVNNVLNKPSVASSMFLQWMHMNKNNELARTLTYVEFPTRFVWKHEKRRWEERKKRMTTIGRIHAVPPSLGEAYFLRILLNKVRGPQSFEEIRKVNGKVEKTFRDACYSMGLLDDDTEYIEAIKEASFSGLPHFLRYLFGTLLTSETLSRPEFVWENTWHLLGEDFIYKQQKLYPGKEISEDVIKNLTLLEIEKFLLRNSSSLKRFPTMPYPDTNTLSFTANRLINDELSFNRKDVTTEFKTLKASLTDEQLNVFNQIIEAVQNETGCVFFVYGYGGTGKTFLWKTLASAIRCKEQIVLNVASSGIASLLLSRGRTAHSRFHIPINLNEDTVCNIKPNSDDANLLKQTKLIIWDEAPMVHKHAIEALDRTLKDILGPNNSEKSELPFGGKVIVFGGDFRQILPVVPNGSRQDIVNASLTSSYIWSQCKLLRLTKNMRLTIGSESSNISETQKFAEWLLKIGEGTIGGVNDGEVLIDIPDDLLITDSTDPMQSLINFAYPSVLQEFTNPSYFSERAILAPKNEVVHEINDRLIDLFPGEKIEYLSSDSICPSENMNSFQQNLYSPDVLNGLKISGLPNHKLVLKVGVPVMLLRNIDQQQGLCNGTRLQIKTLGKRVIEAEIISGGNIGARIFIPRISMIPSDNKIPFKFQRRQFPLTVCFAMTINKSQGQSLSRVGLYLKDPVFTHGQLYVALSRVKSRDGVKLLIVDDNGKPQSKTTNVVYKEVFSNL